MVAGDFKLRIGFEIMGNPKQAGAATGVFTSWGDSAQLQAWRTMVSTIAKRCKARAFACRHHARASCLQCRPGALVS